MSAPDAAPVPASMLAHAWKPGRRGRAGGSPVSIAERRLAVVQLTARRGMAERLAAAVAAPLGVALPAMGHAALTGARAAITVQPGSWLILEPWAGEGALLAAVVKAAGGLGAAVDQTGGKATLRVSGTHAPDALAKLCRVDLHPRAFKPGMAAVTPLGHVNAVVVQIDAAPAYDLVLPATFAETVLEALEAAAAEYGVVLEG